MAQRGLPAPQDGLPQVHLLRTSGVPQGRPPLPVAESASSHPLPPFCEWAVSVPQGLGSGLGPGDVVWTSLTAPCPRGVFLLVQEVDN